VEKDTLSLQAFKMLDHEVTNLEYRTFLTDIETKEPELLSKLQIDKEGWVKRFPEGYVKPMDKLYYTHEAYNDYPVVNISQFAAKEYCKWLTSKLNENKSKEEQIIVRLPKRSEFIRAGAGSNYNYQYAWGNNYLTNSEGKFLCNFTRIPYANMSRGENGKLIIKNGRPELDHMSDGTMYMAKVKSYYPSEFELYNLNGNVAEWLEEDNIAAGGSWYDFGYDVRLQSTKRVEGSSPEVGFRPVFTVVE
jgi:formylglycine-generating enzyme required for sulfatase activity